VDAWLSIDALMTPSMTSHVVRRASMLRGSGIFRTFSSTFPHIAPMIKLFKQNVLSIKHKSSKQICGHAATCFGAICGLLGNIDDQHCK